MKAFVTGGTGFIGSHLTDRLISENISVSCLIRSKEKWLTGKKITKIPGSLMDFQSLQDGMKDADIVYHIAGIVKAPTQDEFDRANVEATENVLRMAMKCEVPKLVIFSSLAACGPSFKQPVNEEDPLMPVTMYGKSKKRMEEMVHRVVNDSISVTIIRPPAVYGPREDQIFSVFQMASWKLFPIIGDGHSTEVSLVHVNDLVDGVLLTARETKPGVETYFISSEERYTWEQIRQATERVFGHKLYALKIKPGFVKKAGTIIEYAASLIGQYPVVNREKALELGMQWTCSVEKAKKQLGFRQKKGLAEGLSETIDWYKRHDWL
ncbi:NAD-dependent epimerase/dehydratase family protein [Balneolaceae bacterium ANBcel3]|nr:NAD-dependent epimerase/dehydratase family protein [Balneolaceae bacterium ANBcel3]